MKVLPKKICQLLKKSPELLKKMPERLKKIGASSERAGFGRCGIIVFLLAFFVFGVYSQSENVLQNEKENSRSGEELRELLPRTALEAEIRGGETHEFRLALPARQTGRVEIVQNGVDVSLKAIDPGGENFIETESPSGFFGDDLILVTAKETGVYKVSVTPANPRAKPGKYSILLKEIRPTVPSDFEINKAAAQITKVAEEATRIKYEGTFEAKKEAVNLWNRVMELAEIKRDVVWKGIALTAQGLIYEQLGEMQKALDAYLESLEIWQKIKNRQYQAAMVNNIANVYSDTGEREKAVVYYEEAIKIQREIGNREAVGIYLNNLAYAYMELKEFDQAEDFFRQSLLIKRENETARGKRSVSNTLNNLGTVLVLKGSAEEGVEFLTEALDLRRKIGYHWGIANSLLNLGKAQRSTGAKRAGFENLLEANRKARELGDRRMLAQSLYHLARAEIDSGNTENALENIREGLEIIERIRNELIVSKSRYAYFSTVQDFYELYTDLLYTRFEKSGNPADARLALELSERSRSRSLLELLEEAQIDFRRAVDPEILKKLKSLRKESAEKYRARETEQNPEKIPAINREITRLGTEIRNLQLKIRRENPKYADLTEGETATAAEIRGLLDAETVLLEYKLGTNRSFLWAVSAERVEIFVLPKRAAVLEKAEEFYRLLAAGKTSEKERAEKLSEDLYRMLIEPVAEKISGRRLAVVAEGILQYIPFSALRNPASKKNLVDENETVVLPSASVLAQIRKSARAASADKTIAVFADPVFDGADPRISVKTSPETSAAERNITMKKVLRDFQIGENLPRLLASREEARVISRLVHPEERIVRTDFQANLENIRSDELKRYRIIHFAAHGLLNTASPELSGLVFSLFDEKGAAREGFLSLEDVYNLELASDLVVLSACQTALGRDVRGEGLIGLSRGFLYAGTKRIVASLWKVDDSATAEFMKLFYRNHLERKLPAAAALRRAQMDLKKIPRYRSPFYWSAFTLLGEWR